MEKPFAVLRKLLSNKSNETINEEIDLDTTMNRTRLDTTVAIENKTQFTTEYTVCAIVKKKLIFKTRPKPIIANVAKKV